MLPEEFTYDETAQTYIFDIDGERLKYQIAEEQVQYSLLASSSAGDERSLSRWLDRQCRRGDIRQEDMLEFCRRSVQSLLQRGPFDLELLYRAKFALAAALKSKLDKLRLQALKEGYQLLLFGSERNVTINFADPHCFPISGYAEHYPALVERGYKFQKHYYSVIRGMKAEGEEYECACVIDRLLQVEYWVRNIDRQNESFWLPLHNGKFYPDFVAKLKDGRTFVVEYKGEHLMSTPETLEKQNIGEHWAETGNGKHIFLMAVKKDAHGRPMDRQIAEAIA
jgi:type III restriction enzyme